MFLVVSETLQVSFFPPHKETRETTRMVLEEACLLLVSLRVQVGKKDTPRSSWRKSDVVHSTTVQAGYQESVQSSRMV